MPRRFHTEAGTSTTLVTSSSATRPATISVSCTTAKAHKPRIFPASSVPVHQLLLNGDWSEDLGDVNNAEVEVFCRSYAQKGARSLRLLILPMVFRPTESTMSTDRGHL